MIIDQMIIHNQILQRERERAPTRNLFLAQNPPSKIASIIHV